MMRLLEGVAVFAPAGVVITAMLVAVAGCSGPHPGSGAALAGESPLDPQQSASRTSAGVASESEAGDHAPSAGFAAADASAWADAAVASPVLASTRRDNRTLAAATPYEDRHGRTACKDGCIQHEAGYKWAALHTVTDENHCAGATPGFVDGCRAYALDHHHAPGAPAGSRKG
jgi:hypothetical protein